MSSFFSCVAKDMKIFGRSKFSAVVTVLVPLLLVLLIGAAFSSSDLQGVQVSAFSSSYSDLSNSIISGFEEQSFVVDRVDSEERCVSSVREGISSICVVFPADLSSEGNSESIGFHVDTSRVNIAYVLIDDVRNAVSSKSSEISLDLVNELVVVLEDARESIDSEKKSLAEISGILVGVNSRANEVSGDVPDLSSIVTKLEQAKSLADDLNSSVSGSSSLKSSISSALSELTSASGSLSSLSDDLDSIHTGSSSAQSEVSKVSSNLEETIDELNSLKVTEAEKIVSPIETEIFSVVDESSNWRFVFPTLLALMVLFGSTVLASVTALREKQSRAYFRNFITPTGEFVFLLTMYVSSIIILLFQLAILLSGLVVITDLQLSLSTLGHLALVLFMGSTAFIFLGMFVGHVFRSEEAVILVSLSLVFLMLFFSNVILPIESILGSYQQIAMYNPLVVFSSMLKKVLLFGYGVGSMMHELYVILGTFGISFLLAYASRKLTRRYI